MVEFYPADQTSEQALVFLACLTPACTGSV